MNARRTVASHDAAQVFSEAARARALVVLTVQREGAVETYKCRFLEAHPGHGFFVLDYPLYEQAPPPELAPGQCVGVSFRHKSRKILFATIVEAKGKFVLDDKTSVSAVRYRWPDAMTELQRRAYMRTPVPERVGMAAVLRRIARPDEGQVPLCSGSLLDLSCGGTLMRISNPDPPPVAENETLRIEIQLPDGRPPLQADVQYRGARFDSLGRVCVALQFVGLEMSVDGRIALQRLASCVQRLSRASNGNGPRG